ncbi:amidohydrolase [Flavilitoribacter nigricans DSM 23189 = NBRC 102662]|uniref:Amidohydrolase n=2 Tax=Flavilitoribacter TaxID=2762562 RepID=A0A2D0NB52_FLAN2|nr:amidohydrolase [Flavilitoribacter nigricans DSM 23189 = NBRC 102662]
MAMGLLSCTPNDPDIDLLITHAQVVDVRNGKILPDRSVAIRNDTIVRIMAGEATDLRAAQTLDASGQYLIPGLWDMHVHFRGGDTLTEENKKLIPLYLAHGITTVRDAGGDLTDALMQWRADILSGTMDGPNIYTSGPKLDGPNGTWAGSIGVGSVEEVSAALDSLEEIGVDYVKIYDSRITADVYLEIIRQAEARGLKTTGHMPFTAKLEDAIDAGLDASEHLYYAMKGCSPLEDSITAAVRENPVGFWAQLQGYIDSYDPATARALFQKMAAGKTAIVPTLYVGYTINRLAEDDHQQDTMLAYIGPGIQSTYSGRVRGARRSSPAMKAMRQDMEALFQSMVRPMQEEGVLVLAGSDCGPFNSFVYPGSSLHEELKLMVHNAGLSPAEALRAATLNGAIFFEQEAHYGSIEPGKIAELVLLEENPLENIESTQTVSKVILRGKVYERSQLQGMMEAVRY